VKTSQKPLRTMRLATIAVTLLSVPTLSIAQVNQHRPPMHGAKTYAKKPVSPQWRPDWRLNLYGSARGRCTWPYQNQFPPCMSTFPQGSPNYHGPIPGPTFDNE
jgi:hypothetical protein